MVKVLTQIKIGVTINGECECKNPKKHRVCENSYIWNSAICSCENDKYVGSIDDSVISCDEIIEEIKTVLTKSTSTESPSTKTVPAKTVLTKSTFTNFYILLIFLVLLQISIFH